MKRKGWDNRGVGPQRVPDGTWGEGHGEVFEPSGTETRNTWEGEACGESRCLLCLFWCFRTTGTSMEKCQAWYLKILSYDSSSRARLGPDRLAYLYRYLCAFLVICAEEQPKPRGKTCRQRWQQRAKSCWAGGGWRGGDGGVQQGEVEAVLPSNICISRESSKTLTTAS